MATSNFFEISPDLFNFLIFVNREAPVDLPRIEDPE